MIKPLFFILLLGCASAEKNTSRIIRAPSQALNLSPKKFGDTSRLQTVSVHDVVSVSSVEEIVKALEFAKSKGLKISMSGSRHSQGGQTFAPGNLILDMKGFNKILKFDKNKKIITVQSGAIWDDVQKAINPSGLAIQVMQASPIFTVGGSISANAHGRDSNYGPLIESVESLRLLKANGEIVNLSRNENAELFSLVFSGLGLFGVILDVDLRLTDNVAYTKETKSVNIRDYTKFFNENIRGNSEIGLNFAWPSIRNKDFFEDTVVTVYRKKSNALVFDPLIEEESIERNSSVWQKSRNSDFWKSTRWMIQSGLSGIHNKNLSRNNAMRPEIRFIYHNESKEYSDPLQEYFVPVENFSKFALEMKKIFEKNKVNLMSATLRHVKANSESFLTYAPKDSIAVVIVYSQKLTPEAETETVKWTRELVDLVISHGGRYYLVYQNYPTPQQLQRAYPNIEEFFAKKIAYDPNELFVNQFYLDYSKSNRR